MAHWATIIVSVLIIIGLSVWLWRFPALRPYISGFGAGLAAFLAPMPGFLTPETRGKWLIAIGVTALIGLGTWFSTDYVQREKDRVQQERDRVQRERDRSRESAHLQQEFFTTTIKNLPAKEQSEFLLSSGHRLNELFVQRQGEAVLGPASVMTEIDHGNGHALYFSGEVLRGLRRQTDMRRAFQHYLAAAESHEEAFVGDYRGCSASPSGFCGERTAWIRHLMALDYYRESLTASSTASRIDQLRTAFMYERGAMKLQTSGFKRDGSLESSCEILQGIKAQLTALGEMTSDVDSVL